MTRPVVYTGDIFRLQSRGGISRYFGEMIARLKRPAEIVAGWHQSRVLADLRVPLGEAGYLAQRTGITRPRALLNAAWDRRRLAPRADAIVHPTYYRNPRSLPSSAPLVATVYDMAHERFPELFGRRSWSAPDPARWKRALCARADRVVCISEATRRDLLGTWEIPAAKLRVIHAGAPDWSSVTPSPVAGVEGPFFLWVGERHTYKNFARTLEAWAGSRAGRATRLLCIGGGAFRPDERSAIARHGAEERVTQRDVSDGELRWAYEHAAGLLYTSLCEGFGLPVLEAMSVGCPVVGSEAAALPEVAGGEAIQADPESRESLAAAIDRCLDEGRAPGRAEALRARAAGFSWDRCAREHERLYEELD